LGKVAKRLGGKGDGNGCKHGSVTLRKEEVGGECCKRETEENL